MKSSIMMFAVLLLAFTCNAFRSSILQQESDADIIEVAVRANGKKASQKNRQASTSAGRKRNNSTSAAKEQTSDADAAVRIWEATLGTPPPWLNTYAQKCFAGYLDVAYHNKEHALDVYGFMLNVFLKDTRKVAWLAKTALALSALCHDYGHPGLNNGFMNKFCDDQIDTALLNPVELSGANAIKAEICSKPQVGGSAGSFMAYTPTSGLAVLPPDANLSFPAFQGCGKTSEGCSSIEETFHASKAAAYWELETFEINRRSSLVRMRKRRKFAAMLKDTVLATDFGYDFALREQLASLKGRAGAELSRHIAMHAADINAASAPNFVWWSASVLAEFARQYHVGGPGPPPAANVHEVAKNQFSWSLGVRALLYASYQALGVNAGYTGKDVLKDGAAVVAADSESSVAVEAFQLLERNILLWRDCAAATKDSADKHPIESNSKSSSVQLREVIIQKTLQACGWAGHPEYGLQLSRW